MKMHRRDAVAHLKIALQPQYIVRPWLIFRFGTIISLPAGLGSLEIEYMVHYGNTGCGVFKRAVQN